MCAFQSAGREGIALNSPAKVNLFFRVHQKRPDGFHEISSLYQTIDLFDRLVVLPAERDGFSCTDPSIPLDEKNLVLKALILFRTYTGWNLPVSIHLEKRIPIEAGLGGGSGNAATALWAFNRLSGLQIPEGQLAEWAAEFSSDAPFFFSLGTAYCRGRGERIERLPSLKPLSFYVVKPFYGLATPLVYRHCRPQELPERDPKLFLERALRGDLEIFNDLEESAFSLLPELKTLKQTLLSYGFEAVMLTGSGTALICIGAISSPPQLENMQFYPVTFTQRQEGHWYE